jgi:adenine-specific DNA-methyltransferase
MSQKYEKLKKLLKEMFQLDHPDLDFGLYRIMHAKSAEVTQFLDHDLLPQVKEAFGQYKTADRTVLEQQLAKAIEQAQSLGADPESLPKVKELRARLGTDAVDIASLEAEVYDHLLHFFGRYYSEGDFLSKRRYSRDGRYAIPYDGEEVKLHWANHDQYYIKTSEYLRDYVFRLNPGDDRNPMRVHFQIAEVAEGEHGNVKAASGKDRVFMLADSDLAAIEEDELVLRFEYRPATLSDWPEDVRPGKTKSPAQKDLTDIAEKRLMGLSDSSLKPWFSALSQPHVKSDGEKAEYSRLRAHLNRYVARNTFDYFIHKDLGGFLRRELDFYIKNEVMQLDDIESETAPRVEQYLSKIKVIRRIAGKLIDFLAQLEDFQKTLWLKKKFVVETLYCIAIKEIPEEFLTEIAKNERQWIEWESLHHISEIMNKSDSLFSKIDLFGSVDFLKANPTLMLDTRNFDIKFCDRLLDELGDIEAKTDGNLIHSENFQALTISQSRYKDRIDCIYIDPPYNSAATQIIYKNDYKHSSWMSLISDRLIETRKILATNGIIEIAIDDTEFHRLEYLVRDIFGDENYIANIAIMHNPKGRDQEHIASSHEYTIMACKDIRSASTQRLRLDEASLIRKYAKSSGDERCRELPLRRSGSGARREDRPFMYFPFILNENTGSLNVIPQDEYGRIYVNKKFDDSFVTELKEKYESNGYIFILPIRDDGSLGRWRWGYDSSQIGCQTGVLLARTGEKPTIYQKDLADDSFLPKSFWYGERYDASTKGTNLLKDIIGPNDFDYPKSLYAVEDMITIGCPESGTVFDYFGGSGTTAHAVIALNRADGGSRKFILVEMGDHFDSVLLPRVKKIAFAPEWKDGKVNRVATLDEIERSPRIIKILRLESYEDALNNIESRRSQAQQTLLAAAEAAGPDRLREQYLLKYMLKVETLGSPSLLNVNEFADPTNYRLKVKRPGSDECRETCVDLIETFNWLLGLTVQHIAAPQTFIAEFERDSEKRLRIKGRLKQDAAGPFWFRTVTGTMPDGRKALVIWRKLTGKPEEDNLVLDEWFTRQGYSSKDSEFGLIFVNGGNNLENLKTPDDLWKVRLLEDDFHRLMFAAEDE